MSALSHRRERAWVERHFAGRLDPAHERSMRAHVQDCASCRDYYQRHLLLAEIDPRSLSPRERLGRGLGLGASRRPFYKPLAGLALAGAAAMALMLVVQRPADSVAGMTSRGGPVAAETSRVVAYRIRPSAEPVRVVDHISAGDELAFAYANPAGKPYLMVFAVDERRRVFWYYPAWQDPQANPRAVAVAAGDELRELPEAVAHDFAEKKIELRWLFVDEPLSVRQVETLIAEGPALGRHLPLAGAVQGALNLEVLP